MSVSGQPSPTEVGHTLTLGQREAGAIRIVGRPVGYQKEFAMKWEASLTRVRTQLLRRVIAVFCAISTTTFLVPAAATASASKVDVCHRVSGGEWMLIRVAEPALAAHEAHGDHVAVHGTCEVIPPTEPLTLAVAWIERSSEPGFHEEVDVLISRLLRNPDGTYEVETHQYPVDFQGRTRAGFAVTHHAVDSVTGDATRCGANRSGGGGFTWQAAWNIEFYTEDLFDSTQFHDASDSPNDLIKLSPGSPSQPAENLFLTPNNEIGDGAWLDIEVSPACAEQ